MILDDLIPPKRAEDGKFRAVINDVQKNTQSLLTLSVKIESGYVEIGEKIFIMPNADPVFVKGLLIILIKVYILIFCRFK